MIKKRYIVLLFLAASLAGYFSCTSSADKNKGNHIDDMASVKKGETLFTNYCQSCHLLPDPKRLPKEVWETNILPLMAIRMGLKNQTYERQITQEEKAIEDANHLIPEKPIIADADYELIKQYVLYAAPDTLPYAAERINRNKSITQFIRRNLPLDPSAPSMITGIKYNPANKLLWISNMYNQVFTWQWGKGLLPVDKVNSVVVDFTFYNHNIYFTEIGSLMPTELSTGSFASFGTGEARPLLDNLHRPVCSLMEDLDNDGIPEIIVGNFGKNLGSLSLFKKAKNSNSYQEQKLLPVPGCVKCFLIDMDGDGRKDIVALFAQADESVYIFFQKDNLQFEAKRVLRFPPDYGTTDLVLTDYNKDGLMDMVTANGDNADYSIVLKNYHGIRVHINQGNNEFKETFFYPVYGATRVLAEDFDQDGDIDFAISCFYPDFGRLLPESFVYLQNDNSAKYQFTSFTNQSGLPVKSLTLEKADIDGDGDMDIILGNFAESPIAVPEYLKNEWKAAKYGLIVFENVLRNKK
ncbi:MAG: VCBS repeat-containing protein [Ginsengibacter sp.]